MRTTHSVQRDTTPPTDAVDPPEFRRLYDEHCAFVFRQLWHFAVPAPVIEDALQDVFIVVFRRLGEFDGRVSLRAWLWGIARRVAAKHARTEYRSDRRKGIPFLGMAGEAPDEQLAARRALEVVGRFVETLSAEHAEVFVLSDVEGWSAPEIAHALGVKVGTVYSRLHNARARFSETVRDLREIQAEKEAR